MDIVLASQSPRRRELLERMGFSGFQVLPAQGDERADPSLPPHLLVEALARQKCAQVSACRPDALVIAADTVVAVDGQVLGKPRDASQAAQMLQALSGREHTVFTGLAVCLRGRTQVVHQGAQVRFRPLSPEDIRNYIATGEPMDKAGAYGIQGYGSMLVERICGDYYTVMGLPVCQLAGILASLGFDPLAAAAEKERRG